MARGHRRPSESATDRGAHRSRGSPSTARPPRASGRDVDVVTGSGRWLGPLANSSVRPVAGATITESPRRRRSSGSRSDRRHPRCPDGARSVLDPGRGVHQRGGVADRPPDGPDLASGIRLEHHHVDPSLSCQSRGEPLVGLRQDTRRARDRRPVGAARAGTAAWRRRPV